jgi:acetylglutamate kinase
MRVTDSETMDVVEMVLGGSVNKEIVASISRNGGKAIGVTGKDGRLIRARRIRPAPAPELNASEIVDIGHVGEVRQIDREILERAHGQRLHSGHRADRVDEDGTTYNINADLVAGKLAQVMQAEKLMLLTNVAGLMDGEDGSSRACRRDAWMS